MNSDAIHNGAQCAPQRSLLRALGMTEEEMARPMVGIVSSIMKSYPVT